MRVQLALVTNLTGKVDPNAALESCLDVAEHFEATGDRSLEGSLNCVAAHLKSLGLIDEAILVFADLTERRRAAGDAFGELEALNNLAVTLRDAGRTSEAQALYQDGLQKARALEDTIAQGVFLGNLASMHAAVGDLQQALDFYAAALQISRSDDRWTFLMLPPMVRLQLQLGELEEAQATAMRLLDYTRRGLALGVSFTVAAHRALAQVLAARQRLPEALVELQRALEAARPDGYERDRAAILVTMARVAMDAGRPADARAHLQRALSLSREVGSRAVEAEILVALCALEDVEGDVAAGTLRGREALDLTAAIHHGTGELLARYHLARHERRQGALHSARAHLEAALAQVHGQRLFLRRADLREAYATSVDDIEDEYVDLLVELADAEPGGRWAYAALEASEAARGRSLRDQLANSRSRGRTDAEGRLLGRSRDLRDQIRKTLDRQLRQATGGAPHDAEPLELRLTRLSAELAEVEAQIRAASPRDAAIDQLELPSLDSIQETLLGDDPRSSSTRSGRAAASCGSSPGKRWRSTSSRPRRGSRGPRGRRCVRSRGEEVRRRRRSPR